MVYASDWPAFALHRRARAPLLGPETRISEGAIFETSRRRAGDLRSLVVASIITATIVPEFIGISIKAARAERRPSVFSGQ